MKPVPNTSSRSGSLGLKLVSGVAILVLILMSSSLWLAYNFLKEETESFTFEVQANQSQLLGQRFSSLVETVVHTLKVLPSFDSQTLRMLENQDSLLSLEVFETPRNMNSKPRELYDWKGDKAHPPPSSTLIQEILDAGVAYETFSPSADRKEVYLYTLLDPDLNQRRISFARSRLNPEAILKKSAGTDARIVDRKGRILFATKDPTATGSEIDTQDPLFLASRRSPVSIGTLEYTPADGEARLGTYILPGFNVMVLNTVKYSDAMRGTFMLFERMLLVGLLLLGIALVTVVLFSLKITQPLKDLTRATQVISSGDFNLALNETSTDEIGHLSRSMNRMSEKIKVLLQESIEKVRIEQELAIASTLQHRLIPPSEIHQSRYSLLSHYQSAAECGGDWWGYIETDRHLMIMISDATGHGLPPAMLTAVTHGCFSAVRQLFIEGQSELVTPALMLKMANQVILESGKGEINMTMFIGLIDLKSRTLTYSNAGHHSPWMIRREPGRDRARFETLRGMGSRLGEAEGFEPSEDTTLPWGHEDALFLYTDGLLENTGQDDLPFGKRRVMDLLSDPQKDWNQLHQNLVGDISGFYGERIPADDLTYVLLKGNQTGGVGSRA
jgi:serine phosphatase RsbU (regulator of sigma subunit)